jgi:hypothetical protein
MLNSSDKVEYWRQKDKTVYQAAFMQGTYKEGTQKINVLGEAISSSYVPSSSKRKLNEVVLLLKSYV